MSQKAKGPGQEFNSQDMIANLRFADKYLIKISDFFMGIPFFASPILWKILIVIFILGLPLLAIINLFSALGIILSIFLGNIVGILAVVLSLGYLLWLASTTIFSKTSDLKLVDLRGWSKLWMVAFFINLLLSSMLNIWTRGVAGLISVLIIDFITFTLTMYLTPFFARYFYGVIIDGLTHHPLSKFSPNSVQNQNASEDSSGQGSAE